jgi:hypothetical protein
MVSVEIASATRPAVMNLIELVKVTKSRLSERSTIKPIGIANRSHGNITNALSIEIKIGSLVSEIAKSGAATAKRPSERLLITLALKRRLKAGPNFSDTCFDFI